MLLVRFCIAIDASLASPLTLEHERDLTVVFVRRQSICDLGVVLLGSTICLRGRALVDRVETTAVSLRIQQHAIEQT